MAKKYLMYIVSVCVVVQKNIAAMRNGQRLHKSTHNKLDVEIKSSFSVYVSSVYINQEPGEREKKTYKKRQKQAHHDRCVERRGNNEEKNNTEWFFWTAAEQVG